MWTVIHTPPQACFSLCAVQICIRRRWCLQAEQQQLWRRTNMHSLLQRTDQRVEHTRQVLEVPRPQPVPNAVNPRVEASRVTVIPFVPTHTLQVGRLPRTSTRVVCEVLVDAFRAPVVAAQALPRTRRLRKAPPCTTRGAQLAQLCHCEQPEDGVSHDVRQHPTAVVTPPRLVQV